MCPPMRRYLAVQAKTNIMATILLNKGKCELCGEPINEHHPFSAFPAFILNENDPLYRFSDSVCHDDCLAKHSLALALKRRLNEWISKTGPGNRQCAVCKEEILDPDDYVLIDYLASDDFPVSRYNYTHLHRSHVSSWVDLDDAIKEIRAYKDSSNWGGGYLVDLIASLEQAQKQS